MAIDFTQAKVQLDNIATRIYQNRTRLELAVTNVNQSVTDLGIMATAYTQFITDLEALATANPTDAAIQNAKAQKDQMVANFQALNTIATSMQTALAAYTV